MEGESYKPHVCQLRQHEDVIVKYITTGKFVYLRRKLKKIMLVSDKLYTARSVFKSRRSIRYEQERHLLKHFHAIHPFSYWNLYWAIFQSIVHIFCFFFLPLEISENKNNFYVVVMILDLIFVADNVMNFFVGRFEKNINHVILNLRIVATRYLRSTFVIDLISSVNIYFITVFHDYVHLDDATYFWICKFLLFVKLLRLRNLVKHMSVVTESFSINSVISSTLKLILFTGFFFMWYASLVILFIKTNKISRTYTYSNLYTLIYVTIQIIHTFLLFGREKNYTIYEVSVQFLIFEIALTMTGILFYIYLLAHIMHIVEKYRGSSFKNTNILIQLREYCKYKNLSLNLTNKIIDYYKFKYIDEHFREDYIMSTISQQLKETIISHICYELVNTVAIFRDVPTQILSKIFSTMEVVHYLQNDIIVRAGEIGYCMYIILYGTVAVYTVDGQELCHLKDGGHFGEIAIVSNQKRVATVIAIEPCEMYKLTKWAFESIIMPYPELYKRIQNVALKRLQSLHENN